MVADSFISEVANSEVANTTRRQKTACAHLTLELWNLSARFSLDFWPVPATQDYSLFIHTSTYIHRLVDPWDTLQQITTGRSTINPRAFDSTRAAKKPLRSSSSIQPSPAQLRSYSSPRLTTPPASNRGGWHLVLYFRESSRPADVLLLLKLLHVKSHRPTFRPATGNQRPALNSTQQPHGSSLQASTDGFLH